jgi:nicotinate-nucleotide adenylyltransferase
MAISGSKRLRIGVFGGTFDPIHRAHVQMALDLGQAFALDEVRLLPCHIPPHRAAPGVSSVQRAEMVRLALAQAGAENLRLDLRELNRESYSYTLDTLVGLREELGEEVCLCLCMGMDSLKNLDSWYQWEALLDYCHILVAARPGYERPENGRIADWLAKNLGHHEDLECTSRGSVQIETCSLLPISATSIRERLLASQDVKNELFSTVKNYIEEQGLYRP